MFAGLYRHWKKVTLAVGTVGVIGLSTGLFLDFQGAFPNHSFFTNIASSFVGALIGIPVAVSIIEKLYNQVNRDRQKYEVNQLKKSQTEQVRAFIDGLLPCPKERLEDRIGATYIAFKVEFSIVNVPDQPPDLRPENMPGSISYQEYLKTLRMAAPMLERLGNDLMKDLISKYAQIDASWRALLVQWQFTENYLKPQVLRNDLPWLSPFRESSYWDLFNGDNPFGEWLNLFQRTTRLRMMIDEAIPELRKESPILRNVLELHYELKDFHRDVFSPGNATYKISNIRSLLSEYLEYLSG